MENKLTPEQIDILNGLMLGDGHLGLANRSVNARLVVRRAIKDESYLFWQYDKFKEFCSDNSIRRYSNYLKKTNKNYEGISFRTLSNPLFTEFYKKWYNKIKIVPNDLKLNQLTVLIWFLDDGCITRSSSGKLALKFSTEAFSKDEVLFLLELLNKRYSGFKINGKVINGYDKPVMSFIEDINPIFLECMSRKATWRKEFIKNSKSSDIKREKIKEYLINKDEFYLNSLGRYAGFCFNRHNKSEVATTNLRNYLKDYIETNLIHEVDSDSYHLGKKFIITDSGKQFFNGKQ